MGSVYSHNCISSRAAKQNFIFIKMSSSLESLYSIVLSNYKLSIDDKGKLLSMSDTTFSVLALEISTTLSGDRTNEPVFWQQMCPDRYKQSQLWVLQVDPRGLSKGKEPSGTEKLTPPCLYTSSTRSFFISARPIFT